jgi:hypothetical protein
VQGELCAEKKEGSPDLPLFRRQSRLTEALARYGWDRCSVSPNGQFWIGLGPHGEYGRSPANAVPQDIRQVCFVEGPEQAELVEAFAASPEAQRIEFLMIGTSHDYARRRGPGPFNFAPALDALRNASLPALRRLSLGDMEQLFNGNVYYGSVGDITHVFGMAPQLAELAVCGYAELERPVTHQRLEALHIRVDDIGVSGGPLGQATIDNILMSRLPAVRALELSLDVEGVQPYAVPEAFFSDNGFPALECFGMDCLKPDTESRLKAWAETRKIRWTS